MTFQFKTGGEAIRYHRITMPSLKTLYVKALAGLGQVNVSNLISDPERGGEKEIKF